MGEVSLERSGFAQTALVSLVTLSALILFCAVLAYWTWAWLAPRPAPATRASEAPAKIDAAYRLFGGTQRNKLAAAPAGPAIRLLGVAAASGKKRGYAIVQLDTGKIFAAREGADIAPGLRLTEVQSGQIILDRNGARETVTLPEKK